MKFCVNKDLHSRYALLKAAYHFTDEYYIYIDQDELQYLIDITSKEGITPQDIQKKFINELIAQSTREVILEKTSSIRELILARAFASTIIDEATDITNTEDGFSESEIDIGLFKDWYENEKDFKTT